jgi:hypothetical protein
MFHWLTTIFQQLFLSAALCSWQFSVQSAFIESNEPLAQTQLQKLHLKFKASNTWKRTPLHVTFINKFVNKLHYNPQQPCDLVWFAVTLPWIPVIPKQEALTHIWSIWKIGLIIKSKRKKYEAITETNKRKYIHALH